MHFDFFMSFNIFGNYVTYTVFYYDMNLGMIPIIMFNSPPFYGYIIIRKLTHHSSLLLFKGDGGGHKVWENLNIIFSF